ncbi:EF-hand domain-containing protein [Kitasatospora cineracea]|uniref:Ca2+-binding EF-hand superfamily protein n=1 Tax=Kitasatospora cineracea TaxID=88074 RepID=A0A8G1X8Z4_9ACTN|nr:EF-hand domain-containing protein [Kitasatospora cineracea]ROR37711.1 Ca2+-binding EF-hand superfamily protein [Kitasatospora cineracea]
MAIEAQTSVLSTKLLRMHRLLDTDGNGEISETDLTALPNLLAPAFGQPAGGPKAERLRKALAVIWTRHLAHMDTNGNGEIDLEEYERGIRQSIATDRLGLVTDSIEVAAALLGLCDTNGNGLVDRDEYRTIMDTLFGLAPDVSDAAFSHLDRNGDGALEPQEFQAAVADYFTSEDPEAGGNWLFGPL